MINGTTEAVLPAMGLAMGTKCHRGQRAICSHSLTRSHLSVPLSAPAHRQKDEERSGLSKVAGLHRAQREEGGKTPQAVPALLPKQVGGHTAPDLCSTKDKQEDWGADRGQLGNGQMWAGGKARQLLPPGVGRLLEGALAPGQGRGGHLGPRGDCPELGAKLDRQA